MVEIKHATDATFEELVLKSERPVVVDFWAEWCGPCRMVAPEMEKLAEKYEGAVDVVKVDIDANPALSAGVQHHEHPDDRVLPARQAADGRPGLPAAGAARGPVRAGRVRERELRARSGRTRRPETPPRRRHDLITVRATPARPAGVPHRRWTSSLGAAEASTALLPGGGARATSRGAASPPSHVRGVRYQDRLRTARRRGARRSPARPSPGRSHAGRAPPARTPPSRRPRPDGDVSGVRSAAAATAGSSRNSARSRATAANGRRRSTRSTARRRRVLGSARVLEGRGRLRRARLRAPPPSAVTLRRGQDRRRGRPVLLVVVHRLVDHEPLVVGVLDPAGLRDDGQVAAQLPADVLERLADLGSADAAAQSRMISSLMTSPPRSSHSSSARAFVGDVSLTASSLATSSATCCHATRCAMRSRPRPAVQALDRAARAGRRSGR